MQWHQAPVEMTRIFHQRVHAFMTTALRARSGQRGILGRVTDYVIRYEVRAGQVQHPINFVSPLGPLSLAAWGCTRYTGGCVAAEAMH
jgi:hypothetical protein